MVAQIDVDYARTKPTRLWPRLVSYLLFEGRPLTTRGRWINSFVFFHFALEKRLPQLKNVTAPIFIIGAGRSGTTILGIVMSMHRQTGFLNEPKAIWHSAFGVGEDLIGSYNNGPAHYRLSQKDVSPKIVSAMHRIYGAYLRFTGASRVVDKYPELVFRIPMVKTIFPDAKFIFISRNGWDTCSSVEKWSVRLGLNKGDEVHDWWGADSRKWMYLVEQVVTEHPDLAPFATDMATWSNHRDRAVVEWIVTMREGLKAVAADPANVLHIQYEEMCQSPHACMINIAEFVNLPKDNDFLDYAAKKLTITPATEPYSIHDCLKTPFAETMQQLGYT